MNAKELKTLNKIFAPITDQLFPGEDNISFSAWAFGKNQEYTPSKRPTYSIVTDADTAILDFINEVVMASVDADELAECGLTLAA